MTLSDQISHEIFPWDIETFFTLAIVAREWKSDEFEADRIKVFFSIMQAIGRFQSVALAPFFESPKYKASFTSALFQQQFEAQEIVDYKLFRFDYIFNFCNDKVDVKSVFYNKYNCYYDDFLMLSSILWLLFQSKEHFSNDILNFLANRYNCACTVLSVSREDYLSELSLVTESINEYFFCFKPSFKYAFIKDGEYLQLPLPHLIIRNCTSSLLFRLTDNDNALRDLIGKNALEGYLFEIIRDSSLFHEVHPEMKYKKNKTDALSPDVSARYGADYFFFECKSLVPKIDVRLCNIESIESNIKRLSDGCVQLYKYLTQTFPNNQNPFDAKPIPPQECIWGILVVLEDSCVERSLIYLEAAKTLNIPPSSTQFQWLSTHIGIVSLYNIERYCFTLTPFADEIKTTAKTGSVNDLWLMSNIADTSIKYTPLINFRKRLKESYTLLRKEIEQA